MLSEINQYYDSLEEPNKSCLLALRHIVLHLNEDISEYWKYRMPFYYYKEKMFCYFWIDKKTKHPYIGIAKGQYLHHHELVKGDRKKMKVLPINPNEDIPIEVVKEILNEAMSLY